MSNTDDRFKYVQKSCAKKPPRGRLVEKTLAQLNGMEPLKHGVAKSGSSQSLPPASHRRDDRQRQCSTDRRR